jgi:ribosomal protein S18 acetylase RimI-like enzyme
MRSVADQGSATTHEVDGRAGKVTTDDGIVIRRLDPASGGRVADLFALAFVDEPIFSSVLDCPPRRRHRLFVPFFHALVRGHLPYSELHGAFLDGRLVGCGLRVPPGRWPPSRLEGMRSTLWEGLGLIPVFMVRPGALRAFMAGQPEIARHHPSDRPHWYLNYMGVHPRFRRQGIATRLARYVIDQADRAGHGCYVETAGEGTRELYLRLGFEVRDTFRPLPRLPWMWTLWRHPVRRSDRVEARP